jgi:hypothetical protein
VLNPDRASLILHPLRSLRRRADRGRSRRATYRRSGLETAGLPFAVYFCRRRSAASGAITTAFSCSTTALGMLARWSGRRPRGRLARHRSIMIATVANLH